MSVKRYKVTDGVFTTGRLRVDIKDGWGTAEDDAIKEILVAASKTGRIEKIMKALPEASGDPTRDMRRDRILELVERAKDDDQEALSKAEMMLRELLLVPLVQRDDARDRGPKKPRGSRMPDLDRWLDGALAQHPEAEVRELWVRLCAEGDDLPDSIFIDEKKDKKKIVEAHGSSENACAYRGFRDRVTSARKRLQARKIK